MHSKTIKSLSWAHALQFIVGFILFGLLLSSAIANSLPLQQLKLPPGFSIQVYAHVPNAREMALGPHGIVFVGSRSAGNVYALLPNANGTHAKRVVVIAKHLLLPNGVAYHDGNLYVGAVNKIIEYKNIAQHDDKQLKIPKPIVITDQLPSETHHGARFIGFGPDGWLYIGVGAPCNVCISKDPRFATIMRMKPNGQYLQIYAKGVRNSVGFAWNPRNRKLWFTDNGRDWLGDNLPPDELNYAPRPEMNFGFPYFYGKNVPDPKFGHLKSAKGMTPAAMDLNAHVAALGMTFYTGFQFPPQYHNQIIIAEHGSWNRSKKIGYRLMLVRLRSNQPISKTPFVTGWLQGQKYWGRPVDVLVMPDGALLVSDDYAGVVYRITYKKPSSNE